MYRNSSSSLTANVTHSLTLRRLEKKVNPVQLLQFEPMTLTTAKRSSEDSGLKPALKACGDKVVIESKFAAIKLLKRDPFYGLY